MPPEGRPHQQVPHSSCHLSVPNSIQRGGGSTSPVRALLRGSVRSLPVRGEACLDYAYGFLSRGNLTEGPGALGIPQNLVHPASEVIAVRPHVMGELLVGQAGIERVAQFAKIRDRRATPHPEGLLSLGLDKNARCLRLPRPGARRTLRLSRFGGSDSLSRLLSSRSLWLIGGAHDLSSLAHLLPWSMDTVTDFAGRSRPPPRSLGEG